MAKKRSAARHKAVKKAAAVQNVIAPDYYARFQCIGGDCEDSCCSAGWRIDIDRPTWQRYQTCPSETLAPLLRDGVQLETSPDLQSEKRYATLKLRPDMSCTFLQADKLCMIHKEMGFEALCDTCAAYPRVVNQVGVSGIWSGCLLPGGRARRAASRHADQTGDGRCGSRPFSDAISRLSS